VSDFEKPDPLESALQSDILDFAEIRGWWAIKVESRSKRGVMDLYALRRGRHVWIEVKRSEDTEATEQQQKRHREVKAQGGEVYVVGSMEQARRILQ
jgi:Holliday junction resolvase